MPMPVIMDTGPAPVAISRRRRALPSACVLAAIALLATPLTAVAQDYGPGGRAPPGYWRGGAPALDGQQYGYWVDDSDARPRSQRRGRSAARAPQQLDDQGYWDGDVYGGEAMQQEVAPRFRRQTTSYSGGQPVGTIIIDTRNKYLYLVQDGGTAIRYGIGVGRAGFQWRGSQRISMKREWPDWRPPADMRRRRPDLPRFMAGGPDNPLGARALYLGSTLYRIHGTNEPNTIGHNVSSGCIRLTNDDVIDLYSRVSVGAKVVVM